MSAVKPGRPSQLATPWFHLALERLESLGIEETKYQNKMVKERLLDSIALSYWKAITLAAAAGGFQVDDVAKRLGVHRSTPHHWFHGHSLPKAEKIFGVLLIVLKKEIDEVGFPRNRQVAWEAVQRTLGLIRKHECGFDQRQPTPEEFVVARIVTCHPHAGVLQASAKHSSDERRRVLEAVLVESRRQLNNLPGVDTSFLTRVMTEWGLPYALFRTGLLREWSFLDGEVV